MVECTYACVLGSLYGIIIIIVSICLYIGSIALVEEEFAENTRDTVINSLVCTGSEARLSECAVNQVATSSCGTLKDAGIVCQGNIGMIGRYYYSQTILYIYLSHLLHSRCRRL